MQDETTYFLYEEGDVFAKITGETVTVFRVGSGNLAKNFNLALKLYTKLLCEFYPFDEKAVSQPVADFFSEGDLSDQLKLLRQWGLDQVSSFPEWQTHPIKIVNTVVGRSSYPSSAERYRHWTSLGEFFKKVLSANLDVLEAESMEGFFLTRRQHSGVLHPYADNLKGIISIWFKEALGNPYQFGHGPGAVFDKNVGTDRIWKHHNMVGLNSFDGLFDNFRHFRPKWLSTLSQYQAHMDFEDFIRLSFQGYSLVGFDHFRSYADAVNNLDTWAAQLPIGMSASSKALLRQIILDEVVFDKRTSRYVDKVFPRREARAKALDVLTGSVRRTNVPKDSASVRGIGIQILERIFLQRGLDKALRDHIIAYGGVLRSVVFLDHQEIQRERARLASNTRKLSTIDFSSASDRIPHKLVKYCFEDTPYGDIIDALRDQHHYFSLSKANTHSMYGGMGNGGTFSIESIVLAALLYATILDFESEGHTLDVPTITYEGEEYLSYGVFGDDCVVPTQVAQSFVQNASKLGFVVNRRKSFIDSPFTESCGAWWYTEDTSTLLVTPIRYPRDGSAPLKKSYPDTMRFIAHHNLAVASGFTKLAEAYQDLALKYSPYKDWPTPTIRPEDSSRLLTSSSQQALRSYPIEESTEYQCFGYMDTVVSTNRTTYETRTITGSFSIPGQKHRVVVKQTIDVRSQPSKDPVIEEARYRAALLELQNRQVREVPKIKVWETHIADFYLGLASEFLAAAGNAFEMNPNIPLSEYWIDQSASYKPGVITTSPTLLGNFAKARIADWFNNRKGYRSSQRYTLRGEGFGYYLPDMYVFSNSSISDEVQEARVIFPSQNYADYLTYKGFVDELVSQASDGEHVDLKSVLEANNRHSLRQLALHFKAEDELGDNATIEESQRIGNIELKKVWKPFYNPTPFEVAEAEFQLLSGGAK